MGVISDRYREVCRRIARASKKAGRKAEDVKLVAVTKTFDAHVVREAIACGMRIFGESRVQEARGKISEIEDDVEWHLIGHLQKNKVKYIFRLFHMVHSIDSVELAREISNRGEALGKKMNILLEVNISGEKSKYGFSADQIADAAFQISLFPCVRVRGLMTIPPYSLNPEDSRPFYRKLVEIGTEIGRGGLEIEEYSMGMTRDFEIAIEEGATIVRVGTAIFGERDN